MGVVGPIAGAILQVSLLSSGRHCRRVEDGSWSCRCLTRDLKVLLRVRNMSSSWRGSRVIGSGRVTDNLDCLLGRVLGIGISGGGGGCVVSSASWMG